MKWRSYNNQQKLLALVGGCVLMGAAVILLNMWGIEIGSELMGKILGTVLLVALTAAILIAIMSNMRDEKKDKDNYFN